MNQINAKSNRINTLSMTSAEKLFQQETEKIEMYIQFLTD